MNEIQFEDGEVEDLETLQYTHVVCAKHFKPYKGGMKLFIEKDPRKHAVLSNYFNICFFACYAYKNDCRMYSFLIIATKRNVSTSTQTYDEEWIVSLKEKCANLKIICGKDIQCRMCASTLVKAISIYDEHNMPLNLEQLINNLLPIEVK